MDSSRNWIDNHFHFNPRAVSCIDFARRSDILRALEKTEPMEVVDVNKRLRLLSFVSATLMLLAGCEPSKELAVSPVKGSLTGSTARPEATGTTAPTASPSANPNFDTIAPSMSPILPTSPPFSTPAPTAGMIRGTPSPAGSPTPSGPSATPDPDGESATTLESRQDEISRPSPDSKTSWDVRLGNHTYQVTVAIDPQKSLLVAATEAGQRTPLTRESFGEAGTLVVTPIENGSGARTLLIEASSGNAGADIRSTVLALDASGRLTLAADPFLALNTARLSELVPRMKDEALKAWVTGKYMGFHTARFQSYTATGPNAGTVSYNVGSEPVLVSGKADVQYDFDKQQFALNAVTNATFEDALASPSCSSIIRVQDPQFGEILAWSENKNPDSYRFAAINPTYLAQAVACGESLDKPFKNGSSYLLETIVRYYDKPELLKGILGAWKPNPRIQDRNGRSAYTIALAAGVQEPELLGRLREGMTAAQATAEEQAVKLALHGSRLSMAEMQQLIKGGISINTDLSDYAYLLREKDPDYSSGTILGSAVIHGDYERTKWLLENGADPNQKIGSGEYKRSPLRAALTLPDLKVAELLLQKKANPDEVYSTFPVQQSLLAGSRCSPDKVALLKKYGAAKWIMYDPDPSMRVDYKTEDEIMKLACK